MERFKKIEYTDSLLGKEVIVLTNANAKQRGFNINKIYRGKLLDKKDWMVGCPVFECEKGKLGLDYECDLVELVSLTALTHYWS